MKGKHKPMDWLRVARFAVLLLVYPLWIFIFVVWPQYFIYTFIGVICLHVAFMLFHAVKDAFYGLFKFFFGELWSVSDYDRN
jgi:hypothetical protein